MSLGKISLCAKHKISLLSCGSPICMVYLIQGGDMVKRILGKIGSFLGTLFGILLALFLGVFFVLLLPLDYLKYKRSLFYKIEHKKYKLFAGSGYYFDFYNEIAKNHLPINYIFNPKNDALECGWFVYEKTLLLPDSIIEYHYDVEKWFCGDYDGGHDISSIPLEEYLQQEIDNMNELLGHIVCDTAVVLVDINQIDNFDVAKQEKGFLIYDNNRVDVLKVFCNSESCF